MLLILAGKSYFYPRSPCGERRPRMGISGPHICISIHALLAESDMNCYIIFAQSITFLSTLSLRRATPSPPRREFCNRFLSTLSLRRATTARTHRPRQGNYFYPRSPCGERLHHGRWGVDPEHFYPRSPCGERPIWAAENLGITIFLSTLSLRRATSSWTGGSAACGFLSTLSLRRATAISSPTNC